MSSKRNTSLFTSDDCKRVRENLPELIDGTLNPVETNRAENHLRVCAACEREAELFQKLETRLQNAAHAIPAPGDLRPGFYIKLAESKKRRSLLAGWSFGAAFASAAGAFAFLFLFAPHKPSLPSARTGVEIASNTPPKIEKNAVDHTLSDRPVRETVIAKQNVTLKKPLSEFASINFRKSLHRFPEVASKRVRRHRRQALMIARADIKPETPPSAVVALALNRPERFEKPETLAKFDRSFKKTAELSDDSWQDADLAKSPSKLKSGVSLASFAPKSDLHISDEERDFMSSSHIVSRQAKRTHTEVVGIQENDESEENADAQPAELPALP